MKKLSKIFAVVLCLALALSLLPMGAAAASTEKSVELTVDSLGLESQKYTSTAPTEEDTNDVELTAPVAVDGVSFDFIQIGNYGNGLQMRDKDGKTSKLWNATAFAGGITKIELTIASTKSAYDNPNCMILTFGDAVKGAAYSTTLSTVEGTKSYTITPDAETYTFFYLEWDLSYSSYWDSIKIYYNETVIEDNNDNNNDNNNDTNTDNNDTNNDNNNDNGNNDAGEPDKTGDNTAILGMSAVMVLAVAAMAVLVIGTKRLF